MKFQVKDTVSQDGWSPVSVRFLIIPCGPLFTKQKRIFTNLCKFRKIFCPGQRWVPLSVLSLDSAESHLVCCPWTALSLTQCYPWTALSLTQCYPWTALSPTQCYPWTALSPTQWFLRRRWVQLSVFRGPRLVNHLSFITKTPKEHFNKV